MVAGCRHALMQKAVNMWTGEMYGYGFYLQVRVVVVISYYNGQSMYVRVCMYILQESCLML